MTLMCLFYESELLKNPVIYLKIPWRRDVHGLEAELVEIVEDFRTVVAPENVHRIGAHGRLKRKT